MHICQTNQQTAKAHQMMMKKERYKEGVKRNNEMGNR
jgi:hypothetical protein